MVTNTMYAETANDFLNNVIIPTKSFNITNHGLWTLRDTKQNLILTSNSFATQLGFRDHTKLINTNITSLPFWDEEALMHIINQDIRAIKEKKIIHSVAIFKLENKIIANITSIIPLFFKNEVVALETPSKFLNQTQFNLELFLSINTIPTNQNPEKPFTKNEIEEHIIYLMILKKTQNQIGELLNISRSRISQRIATMCDRAKIPGYSAKLLIEHAYAANYHKCIPLELFFLNFD